MSEFGAKEMFTTAIFSFIFGFIVVSTFVYITNNIAAEADKNKEVIKYQVVDVLDYKHPGDHEATYYKVRINNHDYTKIETTMHNNIIFKHNSDCAYCKKRGINRKSNESFTTGDGTTIEIREKLNKMKEKK